MNRRIALLAAGLTLLAAPAMAQTTEAAAPAACAPPAAPADIDGSTATVEQMMASKAAVAGFIAGSDTYQDCLVNSVKSQRAAAKASKSRFDERIAKDASSKIDGNQKDKERVGKGYNNAVKAYKAAHPA